MEGAGRGYESIRAVGDGGEDQIFARLDTQTQIFGPAKATRQLYNPPT